ncbi:unnamed protein product [Lampetra fluviatilis]
MIRRARDAERRSTPAHHAGDLRRAEPVAGSQIRGRIQQRRADQIAVKYGQTASARPRHGVAGRGASPSKGRRWLPGAKQSQGDDDLIRRVVPLRVDVIALLLPSPAASLAQAVSHLQGAALLCERRSRLVTCSRVATAQRDGVSWLERTDAPGFTRRSGPNMKAVSPIYHKRFSLSIAWCFLSFRGTAALTTKAAAWAHERRAGGLGRALRWGGREGGGPRSTPTAAEEVEGPPKERATDRWHIRRGDGAVARSENMQHEAGRMAASHGREGARKSLECTSEWRRCHGLTAHVRSGVREAGNGVPDPPGPIPCLSHEIRLMESAPESARLNKPCRGNAALQRETPGG